MRSPEAAIGLIKRRDKAVFEVQSALRMLGKYDPGNETSFVHLSNEDFRRLEDGLKRISNLLDYVSAYIQPYDSKLASYLLAYKTVIILNEAGSAELGKIRAILHRVGKDLGKVKTYTSSNDVETFTKSYQHRPKTVRPFPSKTPLFDPIANPWITQGKATGLEVHGLDMQPDVWDVDSRISTTPRTARSAQFACSANTDEHCLERVPIIHDARQSKLPGVPSPLFSNRSDKKRRGRADVDLGNAGNDLNPSSVDFSQPFASRAEAQDPFPIASHVGPSVTDGNDGWNGNLVTPARQEMLKRQNLARAERGGDSKPVVGSSVTVLPANTDDASHIQPSNVDIIEFAVVDADQTPVTGFTWITSSPPGRLRKRDAESITIMRNHVAAKLRADPRAICLWFTTEAVESNTSGSADAPTLSKHRVNVLLDPYIRLIVGNEMHTVDYSKRMTSKSIPINRASVNVGDLRKRIRAQLSIPEGQRLKLFFRGVTLNNDKVKLRDACSLGRLILQGWAPLYIQVEVEKRRECVVCKDDLSLSSFSHKPITMACSHECNTCRKCVREWIKSSLDSNGLEKLTCTECPSVLQHADVKTHASPRQFERYDNFLTRSVVNADPDFHWCISPTCNSGHSHIPTTSGPIFICPACTLRQCIHHKVPWHTGETCHEYDYRVSSSTRWKEEEQASRKTISDTTKRCPKCEACIEKNEGCDHMTCSRCGHEFCWGCLVHYEMVRRWGNSLHDEKCLHYRGVDVDAMRPPLPPAPPMPRRR